MSFDWFLNPVMNQYADFNGRTTRQGYWMFALQQFLISIALSIMSGIVDMPYLTPFFALAIFIPSIAIAVRRLHDIGKSGWWWLIIIIPFIGIIIYIVFLATKGDAGPNAYGYPAGMSDIPVPVAPPMAASEATAVPLQTLATTQDETQPTTAPTSTNEGR